MSRRLIAAALAAAVLVARAGGVELAATAFGPAAARRLVAPLTTFLELQERVARASDPKALAGKAGALGSGPLDEVRSAVGGAAKKEGAKVALTAARPTSRSPPHAPLLHRPASTNEK
jgi:hypothetical protein